MQPNRYRQLEVDYFAGPEIVKQAYRALSSRTHPDHNQGSKEADDRMSSLNVARDTLLNDVSRRRHDLELLAGVSPWHPVNLAVISFEVMGIPRDTSLATMPMLAFAARSFLTAFEIFGGGPSRISLENPHAGPVALLTNGRSPR